MLFLYVFMNRAFKPHGINKFKWQMFHVFISLFSPEYFDTETKFLLGEKEKHRNIERQTFHLTYIIMSSYFCRQHFLFFVEKK